MRSVGDGICPNCGKRTGPVGEPCPTDVCQDKGYHFIPRGWYESCKEFAARKGRPMDPLLGRFLDRYLLAGKLGEGGMGAVYLAIQRPLDREVALKVISGLELTRTTTKRFEREARAIAALDHPNIVKLHDYGVGDIGFQVPYMALEYVRHGRTLRAALNALKKEYGGRIPGETVGLIFGQVLNALAAAHDQGIIHRDMKPDNVMVVRVRGNPHFVKVLDFGLAKAIANVSGFDGNVSRSGQFLGTPYYMAPEQAPGRSRAAFDVRTDLYAVAVMLFEVFTGARPFTGDNPLAVLVKKVDPNYNPLDLPEARGLPRPLKALLEKGMAADPDRRFQSAGEMLQALDMALAGHVATAVGIDALTPDSSQDRPSTPQSPGEGDNAVLPRTEPMKGQPWVVPQAASAPVKGPVWRGLGGLRRLVLVAVAGMVAGTVLFLALRRANPGRPGQGESEAVEPASKVERTTGRSEDAWTRSGLGQTLPDPGPVQAKATPSAQERSAPQHVNPAPRVLRFTIRTHPPGAAIQVDGRTLGRSPVDYAFEARDKKELERTVTITAVRSGYRGARLEVKLSEAVRDGEVKLDLKRRLRHRPGVVPGGPARKPQELEKKLQREQKKRPEPSDEEQRKTHEKKLKLL